MTPRVSCCGATSAAIFVPALRRSKTIGRWRDSSRSLSSDSTKQYCSTVAESGIISAKGLSTRSFRLRSSATASGLVASQAR